MDFQRLVIYWYKKNKRNLPWRHTNNPYKIWVSEIILQQTRVEQGLQYYNKFIELFPDIYALAQAPQDMVLKVWQGLGYYSRARNMHKTAKYIRDNCNGNFPNNYDELIALKGIGDYTASAIASFAYNLPYAVVDGNVYRLLSRYFNIDIPINSAHGKKYFKEFADELIKDFEPSSYNQAIMEFGALQCIAKNPDCSNCPLNKKCIAYGNNIINKLPVKIKKGISSSRYFNYIVVEYNKSTFIYKRSNNDIWHSLYEFPLIEYDHEVSIEELMLSKTWKELVGESIIEIKPVSPQFKHVLSHQRIYAKYIVVHSKTLPLGLSRNYIQVPINKLKEYPVSKLLMNILKDIEIKNLWNS